MADGILRDRLAGIEYRYAHPAILLFHFDIDDLLTLAVIHRVGEKVHKYFFYFKFIRPCIDGRILFHPHRDIILFGQDRRRLDIILHQCRNVEAFHSHHIVAEFQLVQRQKLFHHVVPR
mgnify:CR=1 FL=1